MPSTLLHLPSLLRRQDGNSHIVPQADGGKDDIDNAIPVCFECHAEVHSYNVKHLRGRRFRPEELRQHKQQWYVLGCLFRDEQFKRAIQSGSVAVLLEDIKKSLLEAYVVMGSANVLIQAPWHHPKGSNPFANAVNEASKRIKEAKPKITAALEQLRKFLKPEE